MHPEPRVPVALAVGEPGAAVRSLTLRLPAGARDLSHAAQWGALAPAVTVPALPVPMPEVA